MGSDTQVRLGAAGLQPGWHCPFAARLLFPECSQSVSSPGHLGPDLHMLRVGKKKGAAEAVAGWCSGLEGHGAL